MKTHSVFLGRVRQARYNGISFEGYFVSECGRVFTTKKVINVAGNATWRIMSFNQFHRELKTKTNNGYQTVGFKRSDKQFTRLVHRLVLSTWGRSPMGDEVCCHLDHDPTNNHISNLKWASQQENISDGVAEMRHAHGETTYAILSEWHVVWLRSTEVSFSNCKRLSQNFNCSPHTIYSAARGISWKHIQS